MSSSDESFRSYVNFHLPTKRDTNNDESYFDDVPPLLENEMVASQCEQVILYSDDNRGFLGKLYCTNFRISFVPLSQVEVEIQISRILNDKHDIPLSCIEEITYSTTTESKRFKVLLAPLSGLENVSKIKVYCKDFRVLTLDFQHSQFAVQLTNTIFHFAFPSKLENMFVCKNYARRHFNYPERFPTFNTREDWERELQRTGAGVHGWRISLFNAHFRQVESYPEWVVVPQGVHDHFLDNATGNWFARRVPIWCWASPYGNSLVRSSDLNTVTKVTEQQWIRFEDSVRLCHPKQVDPLVVDVSMLTKQKVLSSYSSLRKHCTVESSRQFWVESENGWLSQVEGSQWMSTVSKCLEFSCEIVVAMNRDHLSVIIKEFEGCDASCVISSLCQLCLDPFYRTMDGFSMLIQKEWVALGHPFPLRLHGLTHGGRHNDQMGPTFLVFLDCVHQLLLRYSMEFQFSEYFLLGLWDLALTGMTGTFSSNNLKEAGLSASESGTSPCTAWPIDQYYTSEFTALFLNPLYTSKRLLAKVLDRRVGIVRPGHVLVPPFRVADLEFWSECFLRWTPHVQTQRGGSIQTHLRLDLLASEISALSSDKARLESKSQSPVKSPKFRRRPSTDYPAESITSAFPYNNEAIPIPPEYYSLPKEMPPQEFRKSFQIATADHPVSAEDLCFYGPKRNTSYPQDSENVGNSPAVTLRSKNQISAPAHLSKLDSMLRQSAIEKTPPAPPPQSHKPETIGTVV